MQRTIVAVLAVLSMLPLTALAQHDHAGMMASPPAAAPVKAVPMTDGVVKRIDRQAGALTIAHGPLVNLGMPKMTMTFRLKEPSLIDGVKEGSRIRFVAENINGTLTVVALQATN
ncbi:MAG: copper-binding protein [Betaproteobacteria bacterium]